MSVKILPPWIFYISIMINDLYNKTLKIFILFYVIYIFFICCYILPCTVDTLTYTLV